MNPIVIPIATSDGDRDNYWFPAPANGSAVTRTDSGRIQIFSDAVSVNGQWNDFGFLFEVIAAQNTANQAIVNAAHAEASAQTGIGLAKHAQGDATKALQNAAHAQSSAVLADKDANDAWDHADDARNRAIGAQGSADSAQGTANSAQSTANSAYGQINNGGGIAARLSTLEGIVGGMTKP